MYSSGHKKVFDGLNEEFELIREAVGKDNLTKSVEWHLKHWLDHKKRKLELEKAKDTSEARLKKLAHAESTISRLKKMADMY